MLALPALLMLDGGEYSPDVKVTPERLVASALAVLCVGFAWQIGGMGFAFRAALIEIIALTFIWIPDVMARLSNSKSLKYGSPAVASGPLAMRLVAWFILLGVPAAWVILNSAGRAAVSSP